MTPRMAQEPMCANARLAYAEVEASGSAARPLEFPAPTVHGACRRPMNVYDPRRDEVVHAKNVLYRVPTRSRNNHNRKKQRQEGAEDFSSFPQRAYCIQRKISDAIYGSVRLCTVLKLRTKNIDDRNGVSSDGCGGIMEHAHISSCSSLKSEDESSIRHHPASHGSRGRQQQESDDFTVWEATNERVVVKLISWSHVSQMRGRHLEDPLKEVASMQLIGDYHPHVLGSIEAMQDDKYLYSISPYCSGGDLYGKITEESSQGGGNGRLDEDRARFWFRQILMGLHHLQKKGVCHRDLCLENIMVDKNEAVIIDMGMCLRVPYSDPSNEGCVTDVSAGTSRRLMKAQGQGGKWLYMAPEVVAREDSFDGFAIDLWAAGVILYIMLVGLAPFKWAHEADRRFTRFSGGQLVETLDYYNINVSAEAGDLLQNMFWRDPRKRLTLAQVLEHPWFTKRK